MNVTRCRSVAETGLINTLYVRSGALGLVVRDGAVCVPSGCCAPFEESAPPARSDENRRAAVSLFCVTSCVTQKLASVLSSSNNSRRGRSLV